jgi:hypothetical protein
LCQNLVGKNQDDADGDESTEHGLTLCHASNVKAHSVPELIDNAKSRMLLYRRTSFFARDLREKRDESEVSSSRVAPVAHVLLVSLTIHGGCYGYDGTCGAD